MGTILSWPLRLISSIVFLFGTLVVEVLVAMLIYIYIASFHIAFFGEMVRYARYALNAVVDLMETFLPQLSTQAYATLVGELGPKSILLLFLGLLASAIIRSLSWGLRSMLAGPPKKSGARRA